MGGGCLLFPPARLRVSPCVDQLAGLPPALLVLQLILLDLDFAAHRQVVTVRLPHCCPTGASGARLKSGRAARPLLFLILSVVQGRQPFRVVGPSENRTRAQVPASRHEHACRPLGSAALSGCRPKAVTRVSRLLLRTAPCHVTDSLQARVCSKSSTGFPLCPAFAAPARMTRPVALRSEPGGEPSVAQVPCAELGFLEQS